MTKAGVDLIIEWVGDEVPAIVHRRVSLARPVAGCRRRSGGLTGHFLAARRCKGVKPLGRVGLRFPPGGAILRPWTARPSRCADCASYIATGVGHRRHGPARCRCSLTKTPLSGRLSPTSPWTQRRRWATDPPPMSSIGDRSGRAAASALIAGVVQVTIRSSSPDPAEVVASGRRRESGAPSLRPSRAERRREVGGCCGAIRAQARDHHERPGREGSGLSRGLR